MRMPPVTRIFLFLGCWLLWLAPFFIFRPRNRPQAVQKKPVARVGIILQAIAFFLVFLHSPAEWREPTVPWRAALGLIPAIPGIVLAWQSIRILGRQWRVDAGLNADHQLIKTGPYSLVRHPIYASMFLMLLAAIAWFGTMPRWPVALVFFIVGIEIRIRAEDSLLRERFGPEFKAWADLTPAYIPFTR